MKTFLIICATLYGVMAFSQGRVDSNTYKHTPLELSFPVLDLPFAVYGSKTFENKVSSENAKANFDLGRAYTFLSPAQASQFSNNIINSWHWGVSKLPLFKKKRKLNFAARFVITAVGDVILMSLPYGPGWMHEEGHRAVMATSYVFSYNPIIFKKRKEDASTAGVQSVSYVLDTNLVLMKKNDNANFVRLSTMGGEMQNYAMVQMQQQSFFLTNHYNSALPLHGFYYVLNFVNNTAYIATCADSTSNKATTLEVMKNEGNKQYLRDFTGLDFAAWAYDLNRPNEPYANRGLSPNGNGYNRYIYGNRLSDEEYTWLKKQTRLSLLNLVSPMIFNLRSKGFGSGNSIGFSFSLRHYPTSFGNQIGADLLFNSGRLHTFIALHLNQNKNNSFPGLEVLVYEYPFQFAQKRILLTARMIADLQPKDQLFASTKAEMVLLGSAQITFKASKIIKPWLCLEAKNRGWIAGNAFMDKNVSVRMGLNVRVGK